MLPGWAGLNTSQCSLRVKIGCYEALEYFGPPGLATYITCQRSGSLMLMQETITTMSVTERRAPNERLTMSQDMLALGHNGIPLGMRH